MNETLKIVIPMAGWGTRMRPHTWSKPKPLIGLAGRTALDYLLDMFEPSRIQIERNMFSLSGRISEKRKFQSSSPDVIPISTRIMLCKAR